MLIIAIALAVVEEEVLVVGTAGPLTSGRLDDPLASGSALSLFATWWVSVEGFGRNARFITKLAGCSFGAGDGLLSFLRPRTGLAEKVYMLFDMLILLWTACWLVLNCL